ncbi:UDP-N-acetylmuramoyl-L-alanine--D-glutamate ligase [Xanthovirga aplysinae]|uniref:UDP-N-acetylmuramoyl-L-alanine--D-glutamate ligase n=1 Tax=Xanthovirga aplysinae TaxID=2529853 RepID=UPI0012BCD141|nr:UDP-N-acetylmuramoyl-L-alanine--D-glutamate ligase [Xanthovirga aplysinae]MTI32860.1 UDP-N-acetylmuramoyl-L-alanine--D-glutamate ligase [Xanthovirga aplysinae]
MKGRIVILGAGESGAGAAVLAKKNGYDTFVSDKGIISSEAKGILEENAIPFEEGKHSDHLILNADEVVKSPGIPATIPLVVKLKEKGIPIIDELEFAFRFTKAKIIAVTGTNGKTTTTLLIYHLLKEAGLNVGLGGNVGVSMAKQLATQDFDYWVLEVSSFQLDGMIDFRPHIAVLLNITPDHLDRYGFQMQQYIDSKFRIMQNMGSDEHLILFADDENIKKELNKRHIGTSMYKLSLEGLKEKGAGVTAEKLQFRLTDKNSVDWELTKSELPIRGKHNLVNCMAAISAAHLVKLSPQEIRKGLATFQNAPHRMELVTQKEGVDYINDSKATNVESAWYALDSIQKPIIWIAGGTDKGNDYSSLQPLVKERVKALICLGVDNVKIKEAFEGRVGELFETQTMNQAVEMASKLAEKGDVVLLSSACASFDLFKNYEDRGEQFKTAVKALQKN